MEEGVGYEEGVAGEGGGVVGGALPGVLLVRVRFLVGRGWGGLLVELMRWAYVEALRVYCDHGRVDGGVGEAGDGFLVGHCFRGAVEGEE